jgi:hypothetical protein
MWTRFARDSKALFDSGIVDSAWFAAHIDELVALEAQVDITGNGLVHGDTWRQNWCIADRGAVLVDWSGAARGNPLLNRAWAECAIRATSGPNNIVFPADSDEPVWATWMCGRALGFVVDVMDDPRPRLVETVLREAAASIDWMCNTLGIDRPTIAPRAQVDSAWRP